MRKQHQQTFHSNCLADFSWLWLDADCEFCSEIQLLVPEST